MCELNFAMLYTQQQVLRIVDLEQSTFVYWMRVVPRIKRLKGRGCHFTQGDLMALGVLRHAANELGCSISALSSAVDTIFDIMTSAALSDLTSRAIVIANGTARMEKVPVIISGFEPTAVIPLRPVIDRINTLDDQLPPLERLMRGA